MGFSAYGRAAIVAASVLGGSPPAHAALTRAWVSGNGSDTAGCGALVSPCRTLQYTHDYIVAPKGEIDIADGAGYGSLVITKPLTIINDGAGLAGVLAPAGGAAITVNVGTADKVVLRGLTIEGGGVGVNGIVFLGGRRLEITNCVIQNFTGSGSTSSLEGVGVLIRPSSGSPDVFMSGVHISNNVLYGIYLDTPPDSTAWVRMTVANSTLTGNSSGLVARNVNTDLSVQHIVSVMNTVAALNSSNGFVAQAYSGLITLNVDLSHAVNNGTSGAYGNGAYSRLYLSRSTLSHNDRGVIIQGTGYSYGNNQIDNSRLTDVSGTLTPIGLK